MSADVMQPGLYNMDCVAAMASFPDGFFDLAVVDPPYGDGNSDCGGGGTLRRMVRPLQGGTGSASGSTGTSTRIPRGGGVSRQGQIPPRDVERTGGTWAGKYGKKIIAWDVAPGKDYFDALFRVSRAQIIWGGNYFDLPPTRCFLVWNKQIPQNFSMAMVEYAWTSLAGNAKMFTMPPQGKPGERFHPTQKPVQLYSWILDLYARPGMKILDTHAGSASSLVACRRAGLDAWGYEIDPFYFEQASKRLEAERAQINMIDLAPPEAVQVSMLDIEEGN